MGRSSLSVGLMCSKVTRFTFILLLKVRFHFLMLDVFFCNNYFAQVEAIQAKLRFAKKMQNMDKFYVSLGNDCDTDARNYIYIYISIGSTSY